MRKKLINWLLRFSLFAYSNHAKTYDLDYMLINYFKYKGEMNLLHKFLQEIRLYDPEFYEALKLRSLGYRYKKVAAITGINKETFKYKKNEVEVEFLHRLSRYQNEEITRKDLEIAKLQKEIENLKDK